MRAEGRAWVFGDGINTDLLYPQAAYGLPTEEAARMVFRANRPGWADLVEPGDIIVGGRDFGMGSSRPASTLLRHLGISAIVAETVTAMFLRNCVNTALPILVCPSVRDVIAEGDRIAIDIATGTVDNLSTGQAAQGLPLPPFLLDIIESGGLLARLRSAGYLAST